MTPALRRLALALAALVTVGCDQGTKALASLVLQDKPPQSFLAGLLRIGYVENTGAFLGLGSTLPEAWRTVLFTLGSGLLLGAFSLLLWRGGWAFHRKLGLVLLLAGGASNWVDRVLRGSVIDFLNVGVGGLRTGIFNVADMVILAGVAVWVWPTREEGRSSGSGAEPTSPPPVG